MLLPDMKFTIGLMSLLPRAVAGLPHLVNLHEQQALTRARRRIQRLLGVIMDWECCIGCTVARNHLKCFIPSVCNRHTSTAHSGHSRIHRSVAQAAPCPSRLAMSARSLERRENHAIRNRYACNNHLEPLRQSPVRLTSHSSAQTSLAPTPTPLLSFTDTGPHAPSPHYGPAAHPHT